MLGFVLAGIRHRPLRSLTAMVTVALTLALLTLSAAGLSRAGILIAGMPDYLAVMSANSWVALPVAYAQRLARAPGVTQVVYYDVDFPLDGTPKQNPIGVLVAASDGYLDVSIKTLMWVPPEMAARWKADKQGLISNPASAAKMGWKPGEQINLTWQSPHSGAITVTPFHFLGTYQGVDPDQLVAHYDYVDQVIPATDRGQVLLLALFRDPGAQAQTDQSVAQLLKDFPDATKTGPSKEVMASSLSGELATTSLMEKLAWIMLAITAAIVGSTVSMSLRERRSEIGTLRALGFTRTRVVRVVLAESAIISLVGFALGVLVPAALLALLDRGIDLGPSFMSDIRPGPQEVALAAAASLVFASVVSIWPALAAARQDVVVALQEG